MHAVAESDFEIFDNRFRTRIKTSAGIDCLYDGCRWAEGPAYFPAHRSLVWSDIPNDRMLRWDETSGNVGVFRAPAGYSNGNTLDREGRLISCEHGGRRVTRTEHDGRITVIADRYAGRRLNSPNDVVVKSDGTLWFTDPSYGIDSDYEGIKAPSEIDACHVYCVDPHSGTVRIVCDDFDRPNGLAFSIDEKQLYVVDSGGTHTVDGPRHIRVFNVSTADNSLTGGSIFATCTAGFFDGFRFDHDGYLWTSAANGVHCYEPGGGLIGIIKVPERVANVCFGGPKGNRLFICATTSLYAVYLPVNGSSLPSRVA